MTGGGIWKLEHSSVELALVFHSGFLQACAVYWAILLTHELFYVHLFETGSLYVALTDLELTM